MPASASQFLDALKSRFPDQFCLSRQDFQRFLGISRDTERRMLYAGQYPRVVWLTDTAVILLDDLASWLAAGGAGRERRCAPGAYAKADPKKPGRKPGGKSRPKEACDPASNPRNSPGENS